MLELFWIKVLSGINVGAGYRAFKRDSLRIWRKLSEITFNLVRCAINKLS